MNRTAAMDRAKKRRAKRNPAGSGSLQKAPVEAASGATTQSKPKPPKSWQTFLLASASMLLMWAAYAPLGWWPLAWIAPVPLLWLVQRENMPGTRPHLAIWMASFLYWLAVLQGIRLAHPALYGGWIALSWYLAFYPLVFVVVSRVAVHRLRVPLTVAAPAIWVGLELARGYLITGFSGALLGHTQYQQIMLIQISDLFGAYGVSFMVMLCGAALADGLPWCRWWPALRSGTDDSSTWGMHFKAVPLASAAFAMALTLAYGAYRLGEQRAMVAEQAQQSPALQVALLQENVTTIFDYNRERSIDTYQRYLQLATSAVAQHDDLDLIVWPESAFNSVQPVIEFTPEALPPEGMGWSVQEFEFQQLQATRPAQLKAQGAAVRLGEQAAMLVGTDVFVYGSHIEHFNSAALYSPEGVLQKRYGKMHRVMFGEYIPFGDLIPFLYQITPMGSGLTPGKQAEAFDVKGVKLAPNICFESVVPHLIRRQVKDLAARGETPDVLINITNDGWFKGSSILDMHHICGVFRAVENRRPLLVAANIGITAEISAAGVVRQRMPKREIGFVKADLYRNSTGLSPYTVWGDWSAGLCLLFTMGVATIGVMGRFRGKRQDLSSL